MSTPRLILAAAAAAALMAAPSAVDDVEHATGPGTRKTVRGVRVAVPKQISKAKSDSLRKMLANKGRR